MKQETLEEAGERLFPISMFYFPKSAEDLNKIPRDIFINGAKWQQARSYSEEDVKTAFLDGWQLRNGDLPFSKAMKKWFEQFKKE
jgi:hypothetical protein